MARTDLEDRVANLEAEMQRLRTMLDRTSSTGKDWRAIVGSFADDPIFEEAMKPGRSYRESLRTKPSSRGKARR